jgi:chromosome segregation ATPase
MMRKLLLTGGALALLSSVTLGVPLLSYTRCGVGWLRSSASDSLPVEWELQRARQMITDLKPEIEENAQRIAREKVEVARLEEQLSDTDQLLSKAQADIERLSQDLRSENEYYSYGGRTYTSTQVKNDLGSRFKRYKTRQATADKLEQILSARQASLRSAQDRMEAMLSAKRELEVEVENLQARLGALRVAQTSSKLNLDDSQLSQTRELLDEITTRLDVEEETLVVDDEYFGETIQLDEPSDENLLDEISSYFEASGTSSAGPLVAITVE